jgi:hypothetical protein
MTGHSALMAVVPTPFSDAELASVQMAVDLWLHNGVLPTTDSGTAGIGDPHMYIQNNPYIGP